MITFQYILSEKYAPSTEGKFKVYKIVNKRSGKAYIGITSQSLSSRLSHHLYNAKIRNSPLYLDMRKHDKDDYEIDLLATADTEEEINKKEHYFITKQGTLVPDGFNQQDGGEHYKMPTRVTPVRRFTVDEKERILQRYKNGAPMITIAKQYGVNDNTISRIIQRMTA